MNPWKRVKSTSLQWHEVRLKYYIVDYYWIIVYHYPTIFSGLSHNYQPQLHLPLVSQICQEHGKIRVGLYVGAAVGVVMVGIVLSLIVWKYSDHNTASE